jgi:hypothetical protein
VTEDLTRPLPVVALLTVDAALLAMMELFFLTLAVGQIPLPISALVALVSTPWLVRRAGELAGPVAASAPLIAWIATVAVLGMAGPGGDVLLLGDWSTLALVVAGLVPAAFVLGRVIRANREAKATRSVGELGDPAGARLKP